MVDVLNSYEVEYPDYSNCCKKYQHNIKHIDELILLQSIRSGDKYEYEGEPMEFCPWCSKPLPCGEKKCMHRNTIGAAGLKFVICEDCNEKILTEGN